jgi:hypothetical protein
MFNGFKTELPVYGVISFCHRDAAIHFFGFAHRKTLKNFSELPACLLQNRALRFLQSRRRSISH